MGLKSRNKGKRAEREIVALARRYNLKAERSWQTAQSADPRERCCDVRINGEPYQVQMAADGFTRFYEELEGVLGFFFRADRREWLVTLRADDYLELLEVSAGRGGAE